MRKYFSDNFLINNCIEINELMFLANDIDQEEMGEGLTLLIVELLRGLNHRLKRRLSAAHVRPFSEANGLLVKSHHFRL